MPQTLLTVTMITREALRILHNNLVFLKGANRQYSSEFARAGAKIGSSINIRKPNQYFVRTGAPIQVNNTQETYTSLTLTTQYGVDVQFSSVELTLSLDDFSKRILEPALAKLASRIDYDGLALALDVYNQVGLPGYTPGTTGGSGLTNSACPQVFLNAGRMLTTFATPPANRRICFDPAANAGSVAGLSGLYNAQETIAEQYRKGSMGHALGFDFFEDQNIRQLTNGTHGTSGSWQVGASGQTGSTIACTGATATVATILTKGEIVTLAGCYSVNPENQQTTGILQQFVCTADIVTAGDGTFDLLISPEIIVAGDGVANGTVTASPTGSGAVTPLSGTAATAYPVNIAYVPDCFTLGTADLEMPQGVDFSARENYDGVSMRIVRAYDINSDQFPCRIDILAGWKTLRPENACRICG